MLLVLRPPSNKRHSTNSTNDFVSSWNNRIPFVLLFSIATSIQLFQDKLSKETIRRLSGTEFKVERVDTEEIFRQIHDQEPSLFFGPAIGDLILKQRHDFIQSPAAFAQTLKVVLRFMHLVKN